MAKGYPDFFGFSMFPFYGPIQRVSGFDTIDTVAYHTVIDVNAKGTIQSGFVKLDTITAMTGFPIYCTIDTETLYYLRYTHVWATNALGTVDSPIRITYVSENRMGMIIEIREGVTFNNQFRIQVRQLNAGESCNYLAELNYYLIAT